ncbi:hypothetical protein [Williamsia sp.]|uniref:hypothetical protein n=1 Tax=Williamsia sp. TaxID=1872085 RepID=UPI002F958CA2
MTTDDRAKLIDPTTEVWLAEHGLPGFTVAETIDAGGNRQFWIVDRDQLGGRDVDHGNESPAHEQTGFLSERWHDRIAAAPFRCCRPRRDGRPCRILVRSADSACAYHRRQQKAGVDGRSPKS